MINVPPRPPRPARPMTIPDSVTVTVRGEDALVLVLGPLEYAIRQTAGTVPKTASAMRLRQAVAEALREAGCDV